MEKLISCAFNIDTACVELHFTDGSIYSINCTAVENEVTDNPYERSELDYLIYNDPLALPFYTLEGWEMSPPAKTDLPLKGDTVIENDVWIGQNSVILPGVHIGDGAIIGANSVVGSDVAPYTKVVGNPAREIQKRFDDERIELLLRFKWWDRSIDEINRLIPILTCSDLDKVKAEIKKQLG